jgi:hypothetical protein
MPMAKLWFKNFKSDVAVELSVARQVDFAHSAAAYERTDLISEEVFTDLGHYRDG